MKSSMGFIGTRQFSKYHNKKITTPDGVFDSQKEYKEWCQLKLLEKSALISHLERQVQFELIPTLKTTEGTLRKITYVADFYYCEKGKWVVQDTKGFKTPEYEIKKRLFLLNYPNITFIESGKMKKLYRRLL